MVSILADVRRPRPCDVPVAARVTTVSAVIPNFNGEQILPACLDALAAQERPPDEVIVVDNGSADRSVELLRRAYPTVTVIALERNHGFAGGVNRGVEAARGDRVAIVNSDARPRPDWLALLLAAPAPADVWQWGGVLVSPSTGRVESAGDHYSPWGYAYKLARGSDPSELPADPYTVVAAPGAAPLVRRDVFRALGGFEERYFLYYEDIDLALRAIWRGHRALVVPAARVEHDLGGSGTRRLVRYHVARNQLWTAVRCLPTVNAGLLLARGREELRHNRPLSAELMGRAAGVAGLRWALRTRRAIQAGRTADGAAVTQRLEHPPDLPPPR